MKTVDGVICGRQKKRKNKKSKGKRPKVSGRDLTADNCGEAVAPWLHHAVFKELHMPRAAYNSLTLAEFIY